MWKKLGKIFCPEATHPWMKSHAQNPFPEQLGGLRVRVHFCSRDERNRSLGTWVDLDMDDGARVLAIAPEPTIGLGALGTFDDSGVMPSSIVDVGEERYMYYTGWSLAVTVPFSFHIGLAISSDGGRSYRRHSAAPVLGRTHHDPYITGAPWVIVEDGRFRMWYIAGTRWEEQGPDEKPKHYYTIKHATSEDGIHWQTNERLCLPYKDGEYAIARPTVHKEGGAYVMFYSFRGGNQSYRIGKAVSSDGLLWERCSGGGLSTSDEGWDSEMVCYGCTFEHRGKKYLLYNGNGYSRTGFGLAVEE